MATIYDLIEPGVDYLSFTHNEFGGIVGSCDILVGKVLKANEAGIRLDAFRVTDISGREVNDRDIIHALLYRLYSKDSHEVEVLKYNRDMHISDDGSHYWCLRAFEHSGLRSVISEAKERQDPTEVFRRLDKLEGSLEEVPGELRQGYLDMLAVMRSFKFNFRPEGDPLLLAAREEVEQTLQRP
ncbi:hypothetical protein HOD38_02725 [archaeon]|jgi:hypothetical protein|nr:hypothetical protein [archaeon]MBT4397156.1 hypothetical protein [archaeon]MBT4441538.1 hypothetical protein [archaeon]